jgi:very-short-patch-repair endonuclease
MNNLHNKKWLKPIRQALRNKGTAAEVFLWEYLKKSQLEGRKFRRQHSIDRYIVDFFCYEEQLAIELDGEIHNREDSIEKDGIKMQKLSSLGIMVIRFENRMVFEHTDYVLNEIKSKFNS